MNIGFVVGNGTSRKNQNLNQLYNAGTVYSCNWAAVDVKSHHAVIPDRITLFKILSETKTENLTVWTRRCWQGLIKHETEICFLPEKFYAESQRWDRERHWGSGTHAVWKAAKNHDVVILLGFDLWNSGVNNNVYAGQHGYTHDPVDPQMWIYQLGQTFARHPNTSFVQIQNADWQIPESWKIIDNFSVDDYSNLWAMFD